MAYMIEGGGSPTLSKAKAWLYRHQEASHKLLQSITDVCVDYLEGQVKAGAQLLQVFESHAGILGPEQFEQYCLPYLTQIAQKLKTRLQQKNEASIPMVRRVKEMRLCLAKLVLRPSLSLSLVGSSSTHP